MKDLRGKVVLVTGAGRGMGKLYATSFAKEGSRVVLLDIDEKIVGAAAQEVRDRGGEAYAYASDISDRSACLALEKKVASEVGPVDVLINNAGVVECEEILAMSEASIRRITEVNYLGQIWMLQAFLPTMKQRGSGHVVNVCSLAGKVGAAYLGAYCATKFAMIAITDTLRQEFRGTKVKFTIVNPGYISTGMFEGTKPPWMLTRWQEPQTVVDAVIGGVKKNHAEVCWPRFVVRLASFARGCCMPRLTDPILHFLGADTSFATWKKDGARPF